jgi:hypothetical protein
MSDARCRRSPLFYVLWPFMAASAIVAIPVCMLFSLGDLAEEPENHLAVAREAVRARYCSFTSSLRLLSGADDDHRDDVAGLVVREDLADVVDGRDGLAVDLRDHVGQDVARPRGLHRAHPRALGSAARLDRLDHDALDAESARDLIRSRADAERRGHVAPLPDQARHDLVDRVDGDREADADVEPLAVDASAGGRDRRVHADETARRCRGAGRPSSPD